MINGYDKNDCDFIKEKYYQIKGLKHSNIERIHEIIDNPFKNQLYLVSEYFS